MSLQHQIRVWLCYAGQRENYTAQRSYGANTATVRTDAVESVGGHMTNQETATAACLRTLRRREAGEHSLSVGDCIWMWATEYRLDVQQIMKMNEACHAYATRIHHAK